MLQDIKLKSCIKVMYFLDKPDLLEDTPAGGEHIACQPQNPALPKFMQVEGSVNNLWLTKPQTEEFVNQVWDFRKSEEERRGQTVALQQVHPVSFCGGTGATGGAQTGHERTPHRMIGWSGILLSHTRDAADGCIT